MWELYAGWVETSSSPAEVADLLVRWVESLKSIDPALSEWRETAESKAAAMNNPVLDRSDWPRIVTEGDLGHFGMVSVWSPVSGVKLGVTASWRPSPGVRNQMHLSESKPKTVVSNWSDNQIRAMVVEAARVWNPRFVACGPVRLGQPDQDGFKVGDLNYLSNEKRREMPEMGNVPGEEVASGWMFRGSDVIAE